MRLKQARDRKRNQKKTKDNKMNLYYCSATSCFGIFGDYVWARTRPEAESKFQRTHGVWPHFTKVERKAK